MVRLLRAHGADPELANDDGQTAVALAGRPEVIEALR
jgi:hypothetical protein